jgi:hypothetical protein
MAQKKCTTAVVRSRLALLLALVALGAAAAAADGGHGARAARSLLQSGDVAVATVGTAGCTDVTYGSLATTAYTYLPNGGGSQGSCNTALYAGAGLCCNGAWIGTGGAYCTSGQPTGAVPFIWQVPSTTLMCLSTASGAIAVGTPLVLTACSTPVLTITEPMLWQWLPGPNNNAFTLKHTASGLCPWASSLAAGAAVVLTACSSTTAWTWSPTGPLLAVGSTLYMDGSDASAVKLQASTSSQAWASTCKSIAAPAAPVPSKSPPPPPSPLPPPSPRSTAVSTVVGTTGCSNTAYNAGLASTEYTYMPRFGLTGQSGSCKGGPYVGAGWCCGGSLTVGISSASCGDSPQSAFPLIWQADVSGTLQCLDTASGALAAGTQVVITACGTSAAPTPSSTQLWSWSSSSSGNDAYFLYSLKHVASGLCAYASVLAVNTPVTLVACSTITWWEWSAAGALQHGDQTGPYYLDASVPSAVKLSSSTTAAWASTCKSLLIPPPPSPPPSPPAPPPVLVGVASAACAAGASTLAGSSTVTYTLSQTAGSTPGTVAAAINAALGTNGGGGAASGLEAQGVSADWIVTSPYGGPTGGSGTLYSNATGLRCGVMVGGALNRTGFPADATGASITLVVPQYMGGHGGSSPLVLPAFPSAPVTLVCSSCFSVPAPVPTAACDTVAHRYVPSSAVSSTASYMSYTMNGPVLQSGATTNLTDTGAATPLYSPLFTPLTDAGLPSMVTMVRARMRMRASHGVARARCCVFRSVCGS